MTPFDARPRTPLEHFGLHLHAAVLVLRRAFPNVRKSSDVLAFLGEYYDSLDRTGLREHPDDLARCWAAIEAWEEPGLPLVRLRTAAGLGLPELTVLFTLGLAEEDGRFGLLAEAAGAPDRRPTLGLIGSWWNRSAPSGQVGAALRRLGELGLVEVGNPDAPRGEWSLRVAPAAWDALRGERPARPAPWATYTPPEELPALDALVLPDDVAARAAALVRMLGDRDAAPGVAPHANGTAPNANGAAPYANGTAPHANRAAPRHDPAPALVFRGPPSSGRRTLASAVARALGRGVLELDDPAQLAGVAGPLATLLDAVPLLEVRSGPGETAAIPAAQAFGGPIALLLGRHGTLTGAGAETPVELRLGVPAPALRARHWADALGAHAPSDLQPLATGYRMSAGTIRRTARLAANAAALGGRATADGDDVRDALRQLQGHALDRLARRIETAGGWSDLAAPPSTHRELALLELRCRHRERVGGPGVRALFSGPSGTGKTLAARLLAAQLHKDLYAVDLATVVDKYLGETEKNLDEVLSRAEELDVVLLLDEGDALLGSRTDVRSANDRYANLETNFLLQRLESFEGIVVVTTNAGERLDGAFRRRIDVVVEFRAPDAAERYALWLLHLPTEHAVDATFLDEITGRCALTGGQIRNAVLHAELLATERDDGIDSTDVEAAVRREYRKSGAACPLRARHG